MDLNGDGRTDILSGSYYRSENEIWGGLFQVLYGEPEGTFRKAEVLKGTGGKPLVISEKETHDQICTRPFAVDWDGDGHLDLVVGNAAGAFYLFQGEGQGKFRPKSEMIKTGTSPLKIAGEHSDPFAIDWDGDGDLDLLSGSEEGGVQWSENIAGPGKLPQMKPFQMLIKPAPAVAEGEPLSEDDLTGPGPLTRVWVTDFNRDGKLDLLVGDRVKLIYPAPGLSKDEHRKKYADWKKAYAKASEEWSSNAGNKDNADKALKELDKTYNQRNEFMKEIRTGFVWLYLQK